MRSVRDGRAREEHVDVVAWHERRGGLQAYPQPSDGASNVREQPGGGDRIARSRSSAAT